MNIHLLIELTKRDFIDRYSGSILGVSWSFIWPMVNIFIYTVIFSKVMGARLPGVSNAYSYGTYLVAGLVPWMAFASTMSRASCVFVEKKHIISKIRVSLPSLPLYVVLSESITFVITFSIFILFLFLTSSPFSNTMLLLPVIYLAQQLFAYALSFFIAIFHVFFRDLKEVVGIIVQIWFWFTPIVYVVDIVPEYVRDYLVYNPAYLFIRAYQDIFIFGRLPNFIYLAILIFLSLAILLLSYYLFKKLEKDIRDFI